jgi:hypothetical protein
MLLCDLVREKQPAGCKIIAGGRIPIYREKTTGDER